MPREKLADALHRVDPNLRIVEARPWPGKNRTRMNRSDWEKAAGVICSNCNGECFRSRDGLCMECWENANGLEIRDKTGLLGVYPLDVIMAIARPARNET